MVKVKAKRQLFLVLGTRPEAIKMAPVYRELRDCGNLDVRLISTGQHRDLLDQALSDFRIKPDLDLGVMTPGQSLSRLTSAILERFEPLLADTRPDLVMVHGDTATCLATALASFHCGIAVAHVEAGLRTHDVTSPYPEEMNRQLVARLACFHFAPTESARRNLLREGIPADAIRVTGSTLVDALAQVCPPCVASDGSGRLSTDLAVITLHRRESIGEKLEDMLLAIRKAAIAMRHCRFVYPLHPSPRVRPAARAFLGDLRNVRLMRPMGYSAFIRMLTRAQVVLTDSGGVQEEAYYLGRRVVLLRERTERSEGLASGQVEIVGANCRLLQEALARAFAADSMSFNRWMPASGPRPSEIIARTVATRLLGDGTPTLRLVN